MKGKTHIAIGIATGLTISHGQPIENQLSLILASIIGSLAPDLDHPKAKLNQKLLLFKNNFYRIIFYISLSSIFLYGYYIKEIKLFLLLGIVSFLIGISNHRGFTHSIIGALASIYIVKLITINYELQPMYLGFAMGYILHLIADYFTPQGIRMFYPLKVNVSFPVKIKLNKKSEDTLFTLLSLYSIGLLLRLLCP